MSSGKTYGFGAHFGYKLKDIKTSGTSTLSFSSRMSSDRHHYITFNIGDIYKKYGQNVDFFRTVSLSDPDFQQRDIYVGVDGSLLPEFEKMINSITVTMKKEHQNGSTTLKEVNIVKSTIAENKQLTMNYGSVSDSDRLAWLNYDFKAQYNFKGGKTFQTKWIRQNTSMINLYTPYQRRSIKIDGDPALLKSKNVRAITIRIEYSFFGENRIVDSTVKPDDDFAQKAFEITLPAGVISYNYTIRWRMRDGTERTSTGANDNDLLFIDDIPAQ